MVLGKNSTTKTSSYFLIFTPFSTVIIIKIQQI